MSFQRFPLNTVFWVKILVQKSRFCKTPDKKWYIHPPVYSTSSKCLKIKMSLLTQQIQPEKFWHCDDVTGWPRYNGSCPESYKTTKAWYSKPTSQASVTQDWHRGWNMCQLEMMPSKNLLGLVSFFLIGDLWRSPCSLHFFQISLFQRFGELPMVDWIHPKPNKKNGCILLAHVDPYLYFAVPNQREHPQSPGTGLHQRPTLEPGKHLFSKWLLQSDCWPNLYFGQKWGEITPGHPIHLKFKTT